MLKLLVCDSQTTLCVCVCGGGGGGGGGGVDWHDKSVSVCFTNDNFLSREYRSIKLSALGGSAWQLSVRRVKELERCFSSFCCCY